MGTCSLPTVHWALCTPCKRLFTTRKPSKLLRFSAFLAPLYLRLAELTRHAPYFPNFDLLLWDLKAHTTIAKIYGIVTYLKYNFCMCLYILSVLRFFFFWIIWNISLSTYACDEVRKKMYVTIQSIKNHTEYDCTFDCSQIHSFKTPFQPYIAALEVNRSYTPPQGLRFDSHRCQFEWPSLASSFQTFLCFYLSK